MYFSFLPPYMGTQKRAAVWPLSRTLCDFKCLFLHEAIHQSFLVRNQLDEIAAGLQCRHIHSALCCNLLIHDNTSRHIVNFRLINAFIVGKIELQQSRSRIRIGEIHAF